MLETTALAGERGGLQLYSGLAFTVAAGNLLRVRGPNGSGKTTLLRMLAGLARPAAGSVRWRGEPIGDEFRKEMLFLGHAPGLKDELSVLENLEFAARLCCLDFSEVKVRTAMDRLGIAHLSGLPARFLSQGQRKRAALARLALSAKVPLWLLDEPFAALDDDAIAQVRGLCEGHLGAGGMVVLTSHQAVPISCALPQDLDLQ